MERPDLKNDKVVRVGSWVVALVFRAQVFIPMLPGAGGWRMPLFLLMIVPALALCVYMLVSAWRGGYRKFAVRAGIYLGILLAMAALLAWALFTTPIDL